MRFFAEKRWSQFNELILNGLGPLILRNPLRWQSLTSLVEGEFQP
jgi:hypothetical protein